MYALRTHFDEKNIPPAPAYADSTSWAALPWMHDAADSVPDGLTDNQANAPADVFYIHPTTYLQKPQDTYQWNADVGNQKINRGVDNSAILFQASLFNGTCKVYAPRYRQAHYYAFLTADSSDKKKALDVAYADVRAAFVYYLEHYNHNRPIIIAGHSQGTLHAVRLLREFFLNKPLSAQLVAAYLPGMPVPADSLRGIPPCRDSLQTMCFTCWNTFREKFIPRYYDKGLKYAVCTNPLTWTTEEAYAPASLNKGAVISPFRTVRVGVCDAQVHKGLLWVHKPDFPGSFFIRTPVYHRGDYNLFYMNVRENVALRVDEFLQAKQSERAPLHNH